MIGIITFLVFIIRIAEIFIDPLLGNLVDNTKTRWGRFHPWQVIGGVTSSILLFAIFTGLFGLVNTDKTLFIIVFIIVFILLDVLYSLRDISYWGMIPALSSSSRERSIFTSLATFTGSIGYNGVTTTVVPILGFFSGMAGAESNSQAGWTAFGAIICILGIVTALAVAFGTTEQDSNLRTHSEEGGNPLQAFKAIGRWSYRIHYRSCAGSAVPGHQPFHPASLPVPVRPGHDDCCLHSVHSFPAELGSGLRGTGAVLHPEHLHPDDRYLGADRLH